MANFKFTPFPKYKLDAAVNRAFFAAREQILNDCNEYVRVDQGTTRDTAYTEVSNNTLTLVWDTPYAKRIYYTGKPSKNINRKASLRWAAVAALKYKKNWANLIKQGLEDNL